MTATLSAPTTLPEVAVIVATPAFAPVSRPVDVTVTTALFELDQVTFDAGEVLPDASLMVATAWTDVPEVIGDVGTLMDRDDGPVLADPPPHPASSEQANANCKAAARIQSSRE